MTAPGDFASGALLGGRYLLGRRIAAGGMGQVWEATDELLGRPVAVKTPFVALASDGDFRRRFEAEARTTARLSHPGIAQVYDVGEQVGVPYLVMELVHGEPLSALLARDGRLDSDRTLDLLAQTAAALNAAHAIGIVHRDIKPPNILVTATGQVKVTDFGIARATDGEALTRTGTLLGSAPYLSPEQALGQSATAASDVYALGLVAYECLAGHRPFTHEAPAALALAHAQESPQPLPADVPAGVRALIERCLQKDPAERPTADELARQAQAVRLTGETAVETPAERTTVMAPIADTIVAPALREPTPAMAPVDPVAPPVTALRPFAPDPLRRRWRPTLIGVVGALLALALVGVLVHLAQVARRDDGTPATNQASPSASTSARSSASATITVINADDFIGEPYVQARKRLKALGFDPRPDRNVGGSSLAKVTGISPDGPQPAGTQITVTLEPPSSGPPPTRRPTSTPTARPTATTPATTPTPTVETTTAAAAATSGQAADHGHGKPKKHSLAAGDTISPKGAR